MSFLQKYIIGQPETVAITKQPVEAVVVVEEQKVLEVAVVQKVVLPPPPPPPPVVTRPDNLVKPFHVRSLEHSVTIVGNTYQICVWSFSWLSAGWATYAKVSISSPGLWKVVSRGELRLTQGGRASDVYDEMIGAFADAGLMVERRLIEACLYPIQNQVLEIERHLKGY